jgi:putative ABC transport system ATP-binding protein
MNEAAQILTMEAVRTSYRSPEGDVVPILDIAEFAMNAGDQVAMRGISGSGKSTLLNVISGILTPD